MPTWVAGLVWVVLYWVTALIVPHNKIGRGYVTRLLGRVIPPKRWWVPPSGASYRYWLLLTIAGPLNLAGVVGNRMFPLTFWPIIIGLLLDDYFNGGDDWKKRWEGVKNKIKWKMDLPVTQDSKA